MVNFYYSKVLGNPKINHTINKKIYKATKMDTEKTYNSYKTAIKIIKNQAFFLLYAHYTIDDKKPSINDTLRYTTSVYCQFVRFIVEI